MAVNGADGRVEARRSGSVPEMPDREDQDLRGEPVPGLCAPGGEAVEGRDLRQERYEYRWASEHGAHAMPHPDELIYLGYDPQPVAHDLRYGSVLMRRRVVCGAS